MPLKCSQQTSEGLVIQPSPRHCVEARHLCRLLCCCVPLQIIGFDMGGTSTDVSRYAGSYEHVFESTTAGVTIQAPQLDINTVAAGGGSRLFYRCGWGLRPGLGV
eukprot:GHUV01025504.1.p2 GENE.GHUV01025504.1~~GHUV01025504.1.p2  ORF type:complete len:105 (+),score=20.49 GHUV01025504.1:111-425(+)